MRNLHASDIELLTDLPERADVFGTEVSLTSVDQVTEALLNGSMTVAVANVHSVMTARRDPSLHRVLSDADIVTPDGVPLVWALKASGFAHAVRVTGIDVLNNAMEIGRSRNVRHFLYGSTQEVLDLMMKNAEARYPGVAIVGTISPPYGELSEQVLSDHVDQIVSSGAHVVWVGLGMPKQERWMARARERLPGVALIGVGAAFDWFAGTVRVAPKWMRDSGLEWAFRLMLEPRRMWRRYIYNNPAFLVLLVRRWVASLLRTRPPE